MPAWYDVHCSSPHSLVWTDTFREPGLSDMLIILSLFPIILSRGLIEITFLQVGTSECLGRSTRLASVS